MAIVREKLRELFGVNILLFTSLIFPILLSNKNNDKGNKVRHMGRFMHLLPVCFVCGNVVC